jgi:ABC-2 type transport system permease protein
VRLDVVLITAALIACGLLLASVWIRLGVPVRQRILESALVGGITAVALVAASAVNVNWDLSENRQNSFAENDEHALAQITAPLRIEAHLAPKDPRRADLERQALAKLRRVMPDVTVKYISATAIGLFEQTSDHYGEIWYDLGGRKSMNRLTTEEGVLATVFDLADVQPGENESPVFTGHPLAVPPKGAALIFYAVWPAVMSGIALFMIRRNR